MNIAELKLNLIELPDSNDDPMVALVLTRDDEEVLRREARVFSEDDMIATSNEIVRVANLNPADADQALAELIEPIRIRWLRARDQQSVDNPSTGSEGPAAPTGSVGPNAPSESEGPQVAMPRYIAELPVAVGEGEGPPEPEGEEGPQGFGIRDVVNDRVLTNFVLILEEDIEVQDDVQSWREFTGTLSAATGKAPFRIKATDYADNAKLKAALFSAGGCGLIIYCNMDELRRAISTISGNVSGRKLTTNFGWTADKRAYLSPDVIIRQDDIELLDQKAGLRVDLGAEVPACYLGLKKLEGDELVRLKRHIVSDLLALNDPIVTHTLLGAVASAVLYPFARGAGRFALWLVGLTGSGKSFAAKLFANFFGYFPLESASFTTWSATGNFIQRQGYFFKDAMYLVDDYKPELVKYPQEVVRVLQAYADNTARGRLKSDATANVMRPIRGLLVCTGEDIPEHHASAVARSVFVKLPQRAKNLVAGNRCKAEYQNYSGVMADFIRWLLNEDRCESFARRFNELQERFYSDVAGQQNDIRVATNLALLGAAFEKFAEYLGDVWAGWQGAVRKFVEEDLVSIRDGMLGEAKEQQASEVFLRTLGDLIRCNHVRIEGMSNRDMDNKPVVGRMVGSRPAPGVTVNVRTNEDRMEICTSLALAEVNTSLRQQGRSELRITERALLQQLCEDGKLLDQNGERITARSYSTRRVSLDGRGQKWVFTISRTELLGENIQT
jgi:hypothetical protein